MSGEVCLAAPRVKGKQRRAELVRQIQVDRAMRAEGSIADSPDVAVSVKLMRAMGWSEGKGLGADQQGMLEPLAQKANWAQKGLGYDASGGELKYYSVINEKFEAVFSHLGKVHTNEEKDTAEEKKVKTKGSVVKSGPQLVSDGETSDSEPDSSDSESSSESSSEEDSPSLKPAVPRRFNRASLLKPKLARCNAPSEGKEGELKTRRLGAKAQQLYQPYSNGSLQLAPKRGPSPPRRRAESPDKEASSFSAPGLGLGFAGAVKEEEGDDEGAMKEGGGTSNYMSNFVLGNVMFEGKGEVKVKEEESSSEADDRKDGVTASMFDSVRSRYSNNYMNQFVKSEAGLEGTIETNEDSDYSVEKSKKSKKKTNKFNKDNKESNDVENTEGVATSLFNSVQSRYSDNYVSSFVKSENCLEGTIVESEEGEISENKPSKKRKIKKSMLHDENLADLGENTRNPVIKVEPSVVETVESNRNNKTSVEKTKKKKKKGKVLEQVDNDENIVVESSKDELNVTTSLFSSVQSRFSENYMNSFVKSEECLEGTFDEKGQAVESVKPKKRKKKDSKLVGNEKSTEPILNPFNTVITNGYSTADNVDSNEAPDISVEKTKKKKKSKKLKLMNTEESSSVNNIEETKHATSVFNSLQNRYSETYTNSFVKSEECLEGTIEAIDPSAAAGYKPKKKKKKAKLELPENSTEQIENIEPVLQETKKRKKTKREDKEESTSVSIESCESLPKKCKKRNKERGAFESTLEEDSSLTSEGSKKRKKLDCNSDLELASVKKKKSRKDKSSVD